MAKPSNSKAKNAAKGRTTEDIKVKIMRVCRTSGKLTIDEIRSRCGRNGTSALDSELQRGIDALLSAGLLRYSRESGVCRYEATE